MAIHKTWKGVEYTTSLARNNAAGWASLDLHAADGVATKAVARIVFWDAEGQFAIEVSASELPLRIVEEFIREARTSFAVGGNAP